MRRLASVACVALAVAFAIDGNTAEPRAHRSDTTPAAPSPPATAPQADQGEELNLSVGENKTISAAGVKSYSEGAGGIADVRLTPDGNEFVVVGEKPGSTTLLLLKKDQSQVTYTINVFQRAVQSVEHELLQLLDETTGVRVRRVGARFFIEGGVSTEAELKRIQQIASLFPGQVECLVVLGGAAADRKLNVRVDFIFVQFDRDKSYQFGVNYPTSISGPGIGSFSGAYDFLAGATTSAQATIANQPLPGLDIAATKGWAKVLKHSTVITSNGSEAKFSSGGEQNYLLTTGFAASLQQITFGTNVTVLPRYDPVKRELEVHLDAEVTDLTPTVASGTNLPGRNVSKLSTLVALKLGQSIVLSGIRSEAQRHNVRGLPLLSEIPILGVLFGSHADTQEEVEGAIYVVPSIVESIPKGAQEIIDEALVNYHAYDGSMKDVNTWDKNPARAPGVRVNP
ncbi:MAG TPA: pilus assembly protein N-terminal domain-containing protein [Polyangiaceae bacterium]|jgi:pilus assembly protein CpaC|nr:pilus assembly protein N-terminal domain-containing protein [Polyangiaceae bacterium]